MALSTNLARLISTTTKSHPQYGGITPRWLLKLLPYIQVKAGVYRVNRVEKDPKVLSGHKEGNAIPDSFAGYDDEPQEYALSVIETALRIHARVMDVYNDPYDQLQEQVSVVIEEMKESQEYEVINNADFGLLNSVNKDMFVSTETGPPTPNDLDNLLSVVWNRPAFFVANPKTIARFGHECTKRGVCIGAVEMLGSPFQTWRGIPIITSDKVLIDAKGNTSMLLLRVGVENQGVVGLHHAGVRNEVVPSISMRLSGIDNKSIATYILSLYHSIAVHTEDALGLLKIKL
jgi:hypothetical protein